MDRTPRAEPRWRIAISAEGVRPSLSWAAERSDGPGALVRAFAARRDPEGLGRLRGTERRTPDLSERVVARVPHRTIIMAAKGDTLAEITVGDLVELFDAESDAHTRSKRHRVARAR